MQNAMAILSISSERCVCSLGEHTIWRPPSSQVVSVESRDAQTTENPKRQKTNTLHYKNTFMKTRLISKCCNKNRTLRLHSLHFCVQLLHEAAANASDSSSRL
jgi:hypothetical protein